MMCANERAKMNYIEIIEKMASSIHEAISLRLKNAKFDRSFSARVVETKGNGQYIVEFDRNKRKARGFRENIMVGDFVMVCVPRNNWNNLYIV